MSKRSSDPKYRKWRKDGLTLDKKCIVCGDTDNLTTHHKDSWAYNVERRYDPKNRAVLCDGCHKAIHTDFHRSYRVKTTEKDFDNFVALSKYFMSKNTTSTD